MNQIFDSSHFSHADRMKVYRPGEAVVVREIPHQASVIIDKLNLANHFSGALMKMFRHNMPVIVTFASDAVTGYIHSVRVGKSTDYSTALNLLSDVMRDKTNWFEKAYPMTMHCTPRVILLEEGVNSFRHKHVLPVLEMIGCELGILGEEGGRADLLNELEAQIKNRPVVSHRPQSVFDNRVTSWGSKSSGALEQLLLHMIPVIAAYNHSPCSVDGRTPHEKMAAFERAPAPNAEVMRILFGQRRKRQMSAEGRIMVWGVPYAGAPGDAERLYSGASERLVAVDHYNLCNISVMGDDGYWHEMRNTLKFDDPTSDSAWRHMVWSAFKTGHLSYSDFDLQETETFDNLDVLDELFVP